MSKHYWSRKTYEKNEHKNVLKSLDDISNSFKMKLENKLSKNMVTRNKRLFLKNTIANSIEKKTTKVEDDVEKHYNS